MVLLSASVARADDNNLTLERIVGLPPAPGAINDPSDPIRQTMYRSLMSELGVVLAPKHLTTADSLGWSGFQVDFAASFTSISSKADFWQKGVRKVSGPWIPTIDLMVRKGIWLPLPSFEIGAGFTHVLDSSMFALQLYAKFAIHEGYHKIWWLPSIAFRGAVSRALGTQQVDLTIASADMTLSKNFGIGGTWRLEPYGGFDAMIILFRGQVIDTTPNIDAYAAGPNSLDLNANTVFPTQDNIVRWRGFLGLKASYAWLSLTADYSIAFCNDKAKNCGAQSQTQIIDRSAHQHKISFAGSVFF